jgi:hypothetical protein
VIARMFKVKFVKRIEKEPINIDQNSLYYLLFTYFSCSIRLLSYQKGRYGGFEKTVLPT